jgi:hypothetical protein
MKFLVRRAGSETEFDPREGDLSLGGCAFKGTVWEPGSQLEVRFLLPSLPDELKVRAEVIVGPAGSQGGLTRVRFLELPVDVELSIARYLDNMALDASKR